MKEERPAAKQQPVARTVERPKPMPVSQVPGRVEEIRNPSEKSIRPIIAKPATPSDGIASLRSELQRQE